MYIREQRYIIKDLISLTSKSSGITYDDTTKEFTLTNSGTQVWFRKTLTKMNAGDKVLIDIEFTKATAPINLKIEDVNISGSNYNFDINEGGHFEVLALVDGDYSLALALNSVATEKIKNLRIKTLHQYEDYGNFKNYEESKKYLTLKKLGSATSFVLDAYSTGIGTVTEKDEYTVEVVYTDRFEYIASEPIIVIQTKNKSQANSDNFDVAVSASASNYLNIKFYEKGTTTQALLSSMSYVDYTFLIVGKTLI